MYGFFQIPLPILKECFSGPRNSNDSAFFDSVSQFFGSFAYLHQTWRPYHVQLSNVFKDEQGS